MRISIDVTPLLLRSAGVKNYVYHWLLHLKEAAGRHAVETFPVSTPLGGLDHEHSVVGEAATLAGLTKLHLANWALLPAFRWPLRGPDVFHASHQLRRPPRKAKLTATVYDMTCWLTPELHVPSNVQAGCWFGEHIMRRADGLIAISEHTRQDAIRVLKVPPERIETIYPGVADSFFRANAQLAAAIRARHGLERPYVLFLGTIEPRKNVGTLLDAYSALNGSAREEYELVLAGPAGWGDDSLLRRLQGGTAGVRYLGYVPETDLAGLTAGAAVFVYPSLYEGFGFPVAQAMACGVPVVTSNTSCLPEVAGDAALLVDPRSPGELCAALDRLMGSPALRQAIGAEGRRRAAAYTWRACAQHTMKFFERVAG